MSKSYADSYYSKKLCMWMDISTYCNAGCPECHRTDIVKGGLKTIDWLPLIQWSVEDFKKRFEPQFIKNACRKWEFCGTWGDPVMNKDLYKIVKYIVESNPSTFVSIDTNGSIRGVNWWEDLGKLSAATRHYGGGTIEVDFAVEGITQEMHSHYRRKTNLHKVLANMKAFTDSGGVATAFVVIHKHNQDHLHEIKELCELHGCSSFNFVESNRFEWHSTGDTGRFEFIDEKGVKQTLLQADRTYSVPKENSQFHAPIADHKTRTDHNPIYKKDGKSYMDIQKAVQAAASQLEGGDDVDQFIKANEEEL